jgi:tRNA (guanine26-N2/guanine27-N2)-dimethyltransferase
VFKMSGPELDAHLRAETASGKGGIKILDALAATGLRSIRYFNEVPGVAQVVTNDLDPAAVSAAERNVAYNGLTLAQVTPRQGDANLAMLTAPEKFDVIDLDPYGSAAPFLDSAVQAVADGGMLCITCTDMAVLSGNQPEACYSKYGAMPTHGKYLHEMALRIVLHSLETSACRYRRHIVPLLSCGIDFYVRVFVRVFESPQEVKRTCLKQGYVYQSTRCPSFHMQPVAKLNGHSFGAALLPPALGSCAETGGSFRIGGPLWTEPIHDPAWVAEALGSVADYKQAQDAAGPGAPLAFPPIQTRERLHGLLTAVSEELPDVPLYYTLPDLCQTLHCTSPKLDDVRSALINAGYRVSAFHKEPSAIKTDAPNAVVWDIMRCWVAKHSPVNAKRKDKDQSPGHMILAKAPALEADFSRPKKVSLAKPKACRFPANPEEFWGPKARARSVKHQPTPAEAAAAAAVTQEEEGTGEPAAKQARREE